MKSNEFVSEHSNWDVDPRYTPAVMHELFKMCAAAASYISDSRNIKFRVSEHFFDQVKAERGDKKLYTPQDLLSIFAKISKSGMSFFKGKVPGTGYVFYDPKVDIFVAVKRCGVDYYVATTTVHDTQWYGDGQVIDL